MIIKLILFIIFNLVYTLNNYNGIFNLILINTILFLFELLIIKNETKISLKKLILSVFISLVIIILNNEIFIYGYQNKEITITNINQNPIIINSIYLNNDKYKLNDIKSDNENIYDIYNKITSNYNLQLIDTYTFNTNKSRKVLINFDKNNYNYNLLINDDELLVNSSVIDTSGRYYKVYDNYISYNVDNVNYNNQNRYINFIICVIALTIIILSILDQFKKNNLLPTFLTLSLMLFEYNNIILINIFYKIFVFALILLMYILLSKINLKISINDKKILIKKLISSILITFLLIGHIYINNKLTINSLIIFLLFIMWNFYLIAVINKIFTYIKQKIIKTNKLKLSDRILLFIIPLVLFFTYLIIFKPFILTTDGDMQVKEILQNFLTNWHPFFHTLIMKWFYELFGNFQIFIIIRIIIISLIISYITSYFIKKGINKKIIYIITILFCINPITGIYTISILKDIDFVIFLVLLTFVFVKLFNNDLKKSILNIILIFISLIFVALFRHNGLYVTILSSLFLIFITIKNKDKWIIIPVILAMCFIIFVNTFVYDYENIRPGLKNTDVLTLVHGLQATSLLKNDYESLNYLESFTTSSEIKDSYTKYNIDILLHYNKVQFRNVDIDKKELMKIYFKKFIQYPNILISDRLYGVDIMWNVFKSDNIQSYDYQIAQDEFGIDYYNDLKIENEDNFFKNLIINILIFISNNKILNSIFLRTGLYFLLLVIILLNNFKSKNIFILIPFFINIITLLISMHHQSYRYVMFIPIIFLIYFLQIVSKKE